MCGNFGLLCLAGDQRSTQQTSGGHDQSKRQSQNDDLDSSVHVNMREISRLGGMRMTTETSEVQRGQKMVSPLAIITAQINATEIRGGQAGGISSLLYQQSPQGHVETKRLRVRCVARKRHPLADDMAKLYLRSGGFDPPTTTTATFLGHTRFATSSVNKESELHPHEWVPFGLETVWSFDTRAGTFQRTTVPAAGLHITHNGDFDTLEAFSRQMVVGDVGLFLERVLHTKNDTRSDSSKIAGCMDLFRVQGRWAAAARLAWVRVVLSSVYDITDGATLSKSAPNSFPAPSYWAKWGAVFEELFEQHRQNVIIPMPRLAPQGAAAPPGTSSDLPFYYTIDPQGTKQFEKSVVASLTASRRGELGVAEWTAPVTKSFVRATVRGFLRADLYTAVVEFLGRADGSFGLQVHSTWEPGVVVIASKGQPMSMSFSRDLPLCLFASEAEALSVPIDSEGNWLPIRLGLDGKGEVVRAGCPRPLVEGTYASADKATATATTRAGDEDTASRARAPGAAAQDANPRPRGSSARTLSRIERVELLLAANESSRLLTGCGLEIRSYSLVAACERRRDDIESRCVPIVSAPYPRDPATDLVAADLKVTPAVLFAIDRAWDDSASAERLAAADLSAELIRSMRRRVGRPAPTRGAARSGGGGGDGADFPVDGTVDLIISGVEASLWVAEQFASDLRNAFPHLAVVTISANKLLGLASGPSDRVFFTGTDAFSAKKLHPRTCALMISQSGQTFPTLHSTRLLCRLIPNRVWILAGAYNSMMQQVLEETMRRDHGDTLLPRVFTNFSGCRPAEPTTVAIASTWHTLTHLMLQLVYATRQSCPDLCEKGGQCMINAPVRILTLTDGDIEDMSSMLETAIIPTISAIVGHGIDGKPLRSSSEGGGVHQRLVAQGRKWAAHVSETWKVLVIAGCFIIVTVAFEIVPITLIGDAVVAIAHAGGAFENTGYLEFVPRFPAHNLYIQPIGWTMVGLVLQLANAVMYVFIVKLVTWADRWLCGRPMWARLGMRTVVVVDTPCVHQLVESYVSKLYSQAFSFCTVDVHGASGVDHFVHRFTHRVARGLLLAVGRPDGRLCCLTNSEAAVLLAVKQAVFIRNTEYEGPSTGPEVFTVGHNPYTPGIELSSHVVLSSITQGADADAVPCRRKFMDEYLYERLAFAQSAPFTPAILRSFLRSRQHAQWLGQVGRLTCFTEDDGGGQKGGNGDGEEVGRVGGDEVAPASTPCAARPLAVEAPLSSHQVLPTKSSRMRDDDEEDVSGTNPQGWTLLQGRGSSSFHDRGHGSPKPSLKFDIDTLIPATPRDNGSLKSSMSGHPRMLSMHGKSGRSLSTHSQRGAPCDMTQSELKSIVRASLHDYGSMHSYLGSSRSAASQRGGAAPASRRALALPPSEGARGGATVPGAAAPEVEPEADGAAVDDVPLEIVLDTEPLPYGTHYIDESVVAVRQSTSMLAELVLSVKEQVKKANTTPSTRTEAGAGAGPASARPPTRQPSSSSSGPAPPRAPASTRTHAEASTPSVVQISTDPADVKNFLRRLDASTQTLLERQAPVQHFYESRVASLERYLSFCVMFHSMAIHTSGYAWHANPWVWFHVPWQWFRCGSGARWAWDISRSQSNLRVATTASPNMAPSDDSSAAEAGTGGGAASCTGKLSKQVVEKYARALGKVMTGCEAKF